MSPLYDKDKKLGYPEDSLTWLNAWFAKNGEDFKKFAVDDQLNTEGPLKSKEVGPGKSESETTKPSTAPSEAPKQKLIWGMKPVYVYAGGAVLVGFGILGIVKYLKSK